MYKYSIIYSVNPIGMDIKAISIFYNSTYHWDNNLYIHLYFLRKNPRREIEGQWIF